MKFTTLCLIALSSLTVLSKNIESGNYTCELVSNYKSELTKRDSNSKLKKCDAYNGCALVDCNFMGGAAVPQCQCVSRCGCCLRMYDYDHEFCEFKRYC